MNAVVLISIALVATVAAYFTWGSYVARIFGLDNSRPTPAHTLRDGVDYEPAAAPVVVGHHFASIAGAGPIVGPIYAVVFGWLPAFLWIVIGAIFIGAVHDFGSLTASIRHGGNSIGELIEKYVGLSGKRLFIVFAFSALILVVAVFTDVVTKTFVASPQVASCSLFFMIVAIAFGVLLRRFKLPLFPATVIGVGALFGCLMLGGALPIELPTSAWMCVVLAYVFIAAVSPVWVLLQPRDYLNSFLLYMMMAAAIVGIFVSAPALELDSFTAFRHESAGPMFPILFVTVACGSISGFHSLVASGTTSKQLDKESDAKLVGYGSMLLEAVLAVVALIAAAMLTTGEYSAIMAERGPIAVFSSGVGGFMASLGIARDHAVTFVSLTVSAFALTSLDTCTRLARFLFQEFFDSASTPVDRKNVLATNRFIGTSVVVLLGALLVFSGSSTEIWPVFGAANQLLAALALLAVAVWLARSRMPNAFAVIPMVAMFCITLTALGRLMLKNAQAQNWTLAIASCVLLALALILIVQSALALRSGPEKLSAEGDVF